MPSNDASYITLELYRSKGGSSNSMWKSALKKRTETLWRYVSLCTESISLLRRALYPYVEHNPLKTIILAIRSQPKFPELWRIRMSFSYMNVTSAWAIGLHCGTRVVIASCYSRRLSSGFLFPHILLPFRITQITVQFPQSNISCNSSFPALSFLIAISNRV